MPRGRKPLDPELRRNKYDKPIIEQLPSVTGRSWEGRRPPCPKDVSAEARKTWAAWFDSWWSQHWTPEDVPQLRLALLAWDLAAEDPTQLTKFLPLADALGLTPKGRQSLRWLQPKPETTVAAAPVPGGRRLRVVDDALAG
jgi:hypothetical protein